MDSLPVPRYPPSSCSKNFNLFFTEPFLCSSETSSEEIGEGSQVALSAAMPPAVAREMFGKEKSVQAKAPVVDDHDQASGTGSSSNHEMSDGDTPGSREEDGSDLPDTRERRDSGVGSSLTRAPR